MALVFQKAISRSAFISKGIESGRFNSHIHFRNVKLKGKPGKTTNT